VSGNDQITGRQFAAARALAGISQAVLAESANISVPTLRRMEASENTVTGFANNIAAVRAALEAAGVEFIAENGGGAGVRLKKPPLAVAEITEKIQALDDTIAALNVDGEPSPEIGMNRLKKALVQNERTKLKNRRAKIKKSQPK
jgi:transcriptional regulator with XRE-family HTH domain